MPSIAKHTPKMTFARHSAPVKDEPRSSKKYGHRWRKLRKAFLLKNPLCGKCTEEGLMVDATEVDHIKPHRGDDRLFWDESNWQGLCNSHHSRKTAAENGGFGNARK